MPKIKLTQGKFALIDDVDFERLSQWKWHVTYYGYAARDVWKNSKRHKIYMHRQIMQLEKGDFQLVDHINRNPLDNRRRNLRLADRGLNAHNSKVRIDNTTGHKGISFDKSRFKYRAYIKIDGKRIELGRFKKIEEAIAVREEAYAQI